jgi:peptide deformylase
MPEGCLSFPGMNAIIQRHEEVRLVGEAPEGHVDEVLEGFNAQVVQHEMDHLEGILFVDRMTPADLRRNALALRGLEERWKRRPSC